MNGYELKITQIAELSQLSGKQFEAYISSIIESHQNANTQAENSENTTDYAKINATIQKMDETVITDVASATGYLNDEEIELVVIQTKNDLTKDYQEKLTKQIQKKYPQIAKVYYVTEKTE